MKPLICTLALLLTFQFLEAQTPLTEAIDFQEVDIHGESINLFEILDNGQHVIIDFFFVDCVPCQGISPFVNQSYHDFGCNTGDVFYMSISGIVDDTNEDCLIFDEEFGVEYPTISGFEGNGFKIAGHYQITTYPTVILIAPNHEIIEQQIWPIENDNDINTPIFSAGCEYFECPLTGINENDFNSINIFPNPSNGKIKIEFSEQGFKNISILDIAGKLLYQKSFDIQGTIFSFDTNLNDGIYFIQIKDGGKVRNKKLVVIK